MVRVRVGVGLGETFPSAILHATLGISTAFQGRIFSKAISSFKNKRGCERRCSAPGIHNWKAEDRLGSCCTGLRWGHCQGTSALRSVLSASSFSMILDFFSSVFSARSVSASTASLYEREENKTIGVRLVYLTLDISEPHGTWSRSGSHLRFFHGYFLVAGATC